MTHIENTTASPETADFFKNGGGGSSTTNLELGTFFGSNWLSVEQEARNRLEASLSILADECRVSSDEHVAKGIYPLSCGLSQASYCGFNPGLNGNNGVIDNLIFYESLGIRHLLTDYEQSNNKRYGSELDQCLFQCIEGNVDSVSAVSESCSRAAYDVRQHVRFVNELEYTFDQYEMEFRGNLSMIATLSVLASCLVIYLSSNMSSKSGSTSNSVNDDDEEEIAPCTIFCVAINWIAAVVMLGFVSYSCPMFLLVILPPFATIQFLYHCCCAFRLARSSNQGHRGDEPSYILLSDAEVNPTVLQHQIYEGIPIQVV